MSDVLAVLIVPYVLIGFFSYLHFWGDENYPSAVALLCAVLWPLVFLRRAVPGLLRVLWWGDLE